MKRIISVIISISLLLMSVPAFAISGTGTESNPYLISSASDIAKIHNDLDGYYKLTSNINMSGVDFEPIGNENEGSFTGTIDGNGYTISNLDVNLPESKYVGFVGYLEGTIKNLTLSNVDAYGYRYVGGLVGYAENGSYINNCTVSGTVVGVYEIIDIMVGGIVGYLGGEIKNSNSEDIDVSGYRNVGGVVGYGDSNSLINNCSSDGKIIGRALTSDYDYEYIGGIIGCNNGRLSNCTNYAYISNVNYSARWKHTYIGGIVGSNNGITEYSINDGTLVPVYTNNVYSRTYTCGISGTNSGNIKYCINKQPISIDKPETTTCGIAAGGNIYGCINYGDIQGGYGYPGGWGPGTWSDASGIGGSLVEYCINYGNVTMSDVSSYAVATAITEGTIKNSYSNSYVQNNNISTGNTTNSIIIDSYSGKVVIGNYYLKNTYQYSDSFNVLDYNKLKNIDVYEDFDFINTWYIDSKINSGFPQLKNLPKHIELSDSVMLMESNDTDKLYAYIEGVSESVSWISDNTNIATVDANGNVVAKSGGNCTITAINSQGMKAKCFIHVCGKANDIEISNDEVNINKGNTYALSVIQFPNSANETLTWYSENENIATVNNNGVITAVGKGTTTIYAITTESDIRKNVKVNVSAPITSISLSSYSVGLNLGDSITLRALIEPTDYEGNISWSSSDESIATVDSNGKVTTHKNGNVSIIATSSSGVSATCYLYITNPATSIKLNKTNITTYVGSTYQLSATVLPTDTSDTITWYSSDSYYASVSNTGLVTANAVYPYGSIAITAQTSSGLTATCYVTVKEAQVMPTSVALSDTYITLAPDDAKALTATLEPSNTTETTLTWTSSDESVATVDKNGVVTAVSNGFATIRGKTTNGLTSECVVKVVSATGTSVLLDNTKASPGGTAQVKANIVKNPGLSAYKFKVNYDADVLTPVSITPNAEFGGTFSTNLEDANRTELNVLWYSGNEDVVVNGELFTVNFKVNDSAAYGDSSIVSIEYGATDVCDVSGNYIAIYTEDATVSITDPRPGDIYEDSDVNVYDLTLLARYITSLETFTERQEEAADVNDDGRVDILDVIRLAQYLVNWSGIELMSLDLYDEPETPVISVGSASVNESNEAEIPVYIKNNSGILGYRFVLDYNAEDIEILSITPSDLINKDGFNHNLGAESQATDGLVVSCFASGNNITDDGVLFTIKVRYKNPADSSVSPISVVDSFDNIGNENAAYVTATYETGYALGSDYIVANKVVGDANFSCELYFDDSYAEQSAKAIIAFYDGDGRMVQLMPKDITVKPGKVDLSIDYDKKAYATYKLMIWEGLNSLKPITEVK